jgi:hypothetical protein
MQKCKGKQRALSKKNKNGQKREIEEKYETGDETEPEK